jgi:hypothetical protein
MTYVSTVRLNDPQYEANLLIQNTYALRNRIYRSFVIICFESKLRSNRRKIFLHDVRRSKAVMEDWVEEHKDDTGCLNLFNKKYISEQRRNDVMRRALLGHRDNV